MKKKILFLCTGNACRSQIAEGWLRTLGGERFEAYSAGIVAHGKNPRAIAVMHEAGVDISTQESEALDPAMREMLTPVLVAWVVDSRDAAIERGVEEIPREVRDVLRDFVPPEVLEDVRWRVENSEASLEQSLFRMNSSSAITLGDVILFAGLDAAADPKLWAHELFHVMQYREWGIEGFVGRYLADRAAVERDAWEFRWQWMKATNRVPLPQ